MALTTFWPVKSSIAQPTEHNQRQTRLSRLVREYDSQGNHRTGSGVDAASGLWLSDRVDDAGIVPELEWMGFSYTDVQAAYLEINDRRIYGVPLLDGGFTDKTGLSGIIGSRQDPQGIGLFDAGSTSSTLAANDSFTDYRHNTTQQAAILIGRGGTNDVPHGLVLANAPSYTKPFGPTVLQISSEHRSFLNDAASTKATARIVTHVTRRPEQIFNVTATLLGTETTLPPLLVITPRSGWWNCASERGGGIAIWLEMIRTMAAAPTPRRTTVFLASTGHEVGHYGLTEFLRTRGRLIQGSTAWIHLGANLGAAFDSTMTLQTSNKHLQDLSLNAILTQSIEPVSLLPIGERPAGEINAIYDGSGNYVSLVGTNRYFHLPHDRWPSAIDIELLTRFTEAFCELGLSLANRE